MTEPAEILASFEARAETQRTAIPGTGGTMVWRCWGSAEAPPLVLVHGGFGAWNHWVRNIDMLAERFRVIAPDMAGQGDSDDPPQPYDADSLADVMEPGLRAVIGDRPVRIAAFSFGAIIAGLVAARLGDQCLSFTGVGAAGLGERRPMQTLIRVEPDMPEAEKQAIFRQNMAILMFADAANMDPLALHIQAVNTERNRIRSRPISLTDRLKRAIPEISAPVSLIWGAEDVTAIGFIEARTDHLRSVQPDARVEVMGEVGHWVQYEDAARFNERLLSVLS